MIPIFSKLLDLFSSKKPRSTSSSDERHQTSPKADDRHRVSYAPKQSPSASVQKPTPPVAPPRPEVVAQVKEIDRQMEKLLETRLATISEKERFLLEKEKKLDEELRQLKTKQESLEEMSKKQLEKLEQISGLDVEKAKQVLLSNVEKRMSTWIAKKIEEARDSIKQREDEIAKELIVDAIRHGVTDYVAEYTVSTVSLPDDTVKGKIIGREGKNIRAFEKYAGVELELDEGNEIRISSFDSVRREIARLALEKLMKDGRIQPVRIQEVIHQTQGEMDKILLTEGKKICQEVGVFNLPTDLMKYIGRYKFRFSYGQNLAKHTIEAVKIAVALANELHADVNTVRLGTLLHDVGKVINDKEGTHIELGVELLKQFRMPQAVIDAVAEHHEDKPFSRPESVIVYLGDAASGSRPGARYEVHEEYLKRMENIEKTASSFAGVTSVAAYQAGREVMVIVDPAQITDSEITVLSQNIAEKLDEEAKWAGQIKVTVCRENRAIATITGSKVNKNAVKTGN